MKISNSTAGWRPGRTAASAVILCMAAFVAGAALGGSRQQAPPDADLIEFLGTFETASGKEIDPLLLKEEPLRGDAAQKGSDQGSTTKERGTVKQSVKKRGKERRDD